MITVVQTKKQREESLNHLREYVKSYWSHARMGVDWITSSYDIFLREQINLVISDENEQDSDRD